MEKLVYFYDSFNAIPITQLLTKLCTIQLTIHSQHLPDNISIFYTVCNARNFVRIVSFLTLTIMQFIYHCNSKFENMTVLTEMLNHY